jgi:hypothetical protein
MEAIANLQAAVPVSAPAAPVVIPLPAPGHSGSRVSTGGGPKYVTTGALSIGGDTAFQNPLHPIHALHSGHRGGVAPPGGAQAGGGGGGVSKSTVMYIILGIVFLLVIGGLIAYFIIRHKKQVEEKKNQERVALQQQQRQQLLQQQDAQTREYQALLMEQQQQQQQQLRMSQQQVPQAPQPLQPPQPPQAPQAPQAHQPRAPLPTARPHVPQQAVPQATVAAVIVTPGPDILQAARRFEAEIVGGRTSGQSGATTRTGEPRVEYVSDPEPEPPQPVTKPTRPAVPPEDAELLRVSAQVAKALVAETAKTHARDMQRDEGALLAAAMPAVASAPSLDTTDLTAHAALLDSVAVSDEHPLGLPPVA